MLGGCSSALLPMKDTSGSTPHAQSSSKARSWLLADVGLSGSPITPGVPSPNSVPLASELLNRAAGTRPVVWNFLKERVTEPIGQLLLPYHLEVIPALNSVSGPLSYVRSITPLDSRTGPPPWPCGSLPPCCQKSRLVSVGPIAEQW